MCLVYICIYFSNSNTWLRLFYSYTPLTSQTLLLAIFHSHSFIHSYLLYVFILVFMILLVTVSDRYLSSSGSASVNCLAVAELGFHVWEWQSQLCIIALYFFIVLLSSYYVSALFCFVRLLALIIVFYVFLFEYIYLIVSLFIHIHF